MRTPSGSIRCRHGRDRISSSRVAVKRVTPPRSSPPHSGGTAPTVRTRVRARAGGSGARLSRRSDHCRLAGSRAVRSASARSCASPAGARPSSLAEVCTRTASSRWMAIAARSSRASQVLILKGRQGAQPSRPPVGGGGDPDRGAGEVGMLARPPGASPRARVRSRRSRPEIVSGARAAASAGSSLIVATDCLGAGGRGRELAREPVLRDPGVGIGGRDQPGGAADSLKS